MAVRISQRTQVAAPLSYTQAIITALQRDSEGKRGAGMHPEKGLSHPRSWGATARGCNRSSLRFARPGIAMLNCAALSIVPPGCKVVAKEKGPPQNSRRGKSHSQSSPGSTACAPHCLMAAFSIGIALPSLIKIPTGISPSIMPTGKPDQVAGDYAEDLGSDDAGDHDGARVRSRRGVGPEAATRSP